VHIPQFDVALSIFILAGSDKIFVLSRKGKHKVKTFSDLTTLLTRLYSQTVYLVKDSKTQVLVFQANQFAFLPTNSEKIFTFKVTSMIREVCGKIFFNLK
jgi:hypothetical protein